MYNQQFLALNSISESIKDSGYCDKWCRGVVCLSVSSPHSGVLLQNR